MANTDNPHGFRPWGIYLGAHEYSTDASAAAVFKWDRVEVETDGYIIPSAAGSTNQLGSALHYKVTGAIGGVLVADAPDQKLEAQDDGTSATWAVTDLGRIVDHLATTGNTTTMISAHEYDADQIGTVAASFLLLDILNNGVNAWGVNTRVISSCLEHMAKGSKLTGV